MDSHNSRELTYTEVANAIRDGARGPIHKTYVENRLINIKQQKYQYYKGSSSVIGSPYKANGIRNPNFTSPSFLSNAVFYEVSASHRLPENEMYLTTTNLLHSHSYDRLLANKNKKRIKANKNYK